MFWHSFKYALRSLLKNRSMMFWTLAFPFVLALLFNFAFARLHDYDVFEAFDVAVVDDDEFRDAEVFSEAFKSLSEADENRLFVTQYVNRERADELLEAEEIEGYVYLVDGEPHVKVKKNGTNQTVLTTAVSQISQRIEIATDIIETKISKDPMSAMNIEQISKEAIEAVSEVEPNIKDNSRVMNMVVIEFYTLIAMACMQGAMLSSEMIDRALPNISSRGKRIAAAPTRKSVIILSNLLAGYIVLLTGVLGLIAFMRFVLGVEFGSNLGLICAHAAAGSLAAIMMGMFLSVMLKTNSSAKNIIGVIVTMVGCLFAGMFGGQKGWFDSVMPFVNKISPVGLITDGYYALYYYEDMTRYFMNLGGLLAIAAVFMILSVQGLRRQRYDSI
jgi:ABC-2 type transport system permease protein